MSNQKSFNCGYGLHSSERRNSSEKPLTIANSNFLTIANSNDTISELSSELSSKIRFNNSNSSNDEDLKNNEVYEQQITNLSIVSNASAEFIYEDSRNSIHFLKEYYLNSFYSNIVPCILLKSSDKLQNIVNTLVKLETYYEDSNIREQQISKNNNSEVHIKVIDFVDNNLSENTFYPKRYLKTLPPIESIPSIKNYNHDIIFNCVQYLTFLKKYNIVFKLNKIYVVSGIPNLDNAYWNGQYLSFGNGSYGHTPLTSSCIVGHELTHALIEEICNLEYRGQSGALNESYADIFGVMFEDYIHKKYKNLGWEIGSECNMLLRNMANPGVCYQPETIRDMYNGIQDNGGVHINSGIPNHTFYCMSQIIGLEFSFIIFYKTLLQLHSSSTFVDFCIKLEINCKKDITNTIDLNKILEMIKYHFYT